MHLQGEGLHVGGDCKCNFVPGYTFDVQEIQNVGCAVNVNEKGIYISGTNCGAGSTNQCAFLIRKKTSMTEKLMSHNPGSDDHNKNILFLNSSCEDTCFGVFSSCIKNGFGIDACNGIYQSCLKTCW